MNILMLGEALSIHHERIARALARGGHSIVLAGFAPAPIPGVEIIDLRDRSSGFPVLRLWKKIRLLRKLIRDRRIDLVHVHYITVYGLLAVLAGPLPKVLSVHGSDVLIARRKVYNRLVMRFVSGRMERITSPSTEITQALIRIGVPRGRIDTFQYGVDLELFHPQGSAPRPGEPVRIISTRRLAPLYRVDLLLIALARMRCGEPINALIAGDGTQADALAHLAGSLGLQAEVRFAGRLAEEEVAKRLREADVYVSTCPSDGASLSLLEAMATGLLPVVPDIPANRPWIRHGVNGLLFEPDSADALAEALLHAIHEPVLREKARTENPAIVRARANFKLGIQRISAIYENSHQAGPDGHARRTGGP